MEGGAEAASFRVGKREASTDPPHDRLHDRQAKAGTGPIAVCAAIEALSRMREVILGYPGAGILDVEPYLPIHSRECEANRPDQGRMQDRILQDVA
jgi:hypothetical protein